jgi:predicted nucleic acid-binding protein
MTSINTERENLSPSERAKQERRIARYIQQGLTLSELVRGLAISETTARKVAAQFGLKIAGTRT